MVSSNSPTSRHHGAPKVRKRDLFFFLRLDLLLLLHGRLRVRTLREHLPFVELLLGHLETRGPPARHVLRDRKAELEQLTMNARRTPKEILYAHAPDQCPQIYRDLWPASQVSRFPTQMAAKTSTVPAPFEDAIDQRGRTLENLAPVRSIRHQAALTSKRIGLVNRWQASLGSVLDSA